MHAITGAYAPSQELVLRVDDIRHIFTAQDTDPLFRHEGEVMGQPGARSFAQPDL